MSKKCCTFAQNLESMKKIYYILLVAVLLFSLNNYAEQPSYHFANFAEALAALPPFPVVEQIITSDAVQTAHGSVYYPYLVAVEQFAATVGNEQPAQTPAGNSQAEPAADPNQQRLSDLYPPITALMQQLAVTYGEYINLQTQALDYQSYIDKGGAEMANVTVGAKVQGAKLRMLYRQLKQQWPQSPEGKQVADIEAQLDKRVKDWKKTVKYHVAADLPYPDWWTEGREKENELIAQWNNKSAAEWLKTAEVEQQKFKNIFLQMLPLQQEIEQLGNSGSANNPTFRICKDMIDVVVSQLTFLTYPMQDALQFPYVPLVTTQGTIHLGVGL